MNGRNVITGLGVAGPLGIGRDALAKALDEGPTPVDAGEVDLGEHIKAARTYLDPNSQWSLLATSLALKDAALTIGGEAAGTVGMSFGTRLGNVATTEVYLGMLREQGVKLASPLLFIHAYPNTSVSLAAIEFAVRGTSFNFNSGRWCGLQALVQSSDELRRGEMTVMLAASADTYTEITRPAAVGTPMRGAATVVLERADAALNRGARPLAEVAGGGLSGTLKDAIARALAEASMGRPEIDWVLIDAPAEIVASADLGTHVTDLAKIAGDTGAATAMLGVALASLALARDERPSGMGLAEAPRTALVASADETGAAAVVLTRPTH